MEESNRPSGRDKEEIEPHWQLTIERNSLKESLDFTVSKCERQGQFIAGLADWIENNKKNPPKNFLDQIQKEIALHMSNEIKFLKNRIKGYSEGQN